MTAVASWTPQVSRSMTIALHVFITYNVYTENTKLAQNQLNRLFLPTVNIFIILVKKTKFKYDFNPNWLT